MQNRTRHVVTGILAACLLATVGFTGVVAAHGPNGGHPGIPGTSAKPLPSGWVWPSDVATQKPHDPSKTEKPNPAKTDKPTPTCTPTPAPTAAEAAAQQKGIQPGMKGNWDKMVTDLRSHYDASWAKIYCQIDPLRTSLDKQISGRISSLQDLITKIGKSGLGASDQAIVAAELNLAIADLTTLKAKVDADTTLADLQADLQTFNAKTALYRSATQWAQLLIGAEKLIASETDLAALQAKVAAEIAAAPAGPETADAQIYLKNMNLAITAGSSLVGPLPAALLAITPAQFADGSANAVLTSARATLFRATWDFQLARWAAHWAERELPKATATPTPVATPVATPV